MPLYFAYGSNMLRARLERRVGAVLDRGCQPLLDYRHTFAKRGSDGTAKGAILPAAARRVYGVAYELTDAQLDALVPFEGGYRQIEVVVEGALAYTFEPLPHTLARGLEPTQRYVRYYFDGMAEHDFPSDYVAEIRAQLMGHHDGS